MTLESIHSILAPNIPAPALTYCLELWRLHPFVLKLTRTRQTKIGDFTAKRLAGHFRITLNRDLNPYLFLVTYVHEVAHLHVYIRHGNRVDAHGEEWKRVFQDLLIPLLQESVFPDEILHPLRRHMVNPKASSYSDAELTTVFRRYDQHADKHVALSDLPEGSIFKLQGRYFKKGKLRRTRIVCQELKTRRAYLVPAEALVTDVQLSLL